MNTTARHGTCLECGNPLREGQSPNAEFCCREHQKAFNRRREKRALLIYDLFMATRFERKLSKQLELWTAICRAAMHYRNEDVKERGGRRSWMHARKVLEQNPILRAVVYNTN